MPTSIPDFDKEYRHGAALKWMNVGYSEVERPVLDSATYQEICEELATRLSDVAQLAPGDTVVDVGCGYGSQDIHFSRLTPDLNIHAVNISERQIESARAQLSGLPEEFQRTINYSQGDAVNLQFQSDFADKVLSLESAFHFDTRETFFSEAMRVLKPGGLLALADVIVSDQPQKLKLNGACWNTPMIRLLRWFSLRVQTDRHDDPIPRENRYDLQTYIGKLASAGFVNVTTRNISEYAVLWPNQRSAASTRWWQMLPKPWIPGWAQPAMYFPWLSDAGAQYFLVKAEKPRRSDG